MTEQEATAWRTHILRAARNGVTKGVQDILGQRLTDRIDQMNRRNGTKPVFVDSVGNRGWYIAGIRGEWRVVHVDIEPETPPVVRGADTVIIDDPMGT